MHLLMMVPAFTSRAANNEVVPCRLSSWVRRSACPGRIGSSGWVRSSAWICDFSSTQSTSDASRGVIEEDGASRPSNQDRSLSGPTDGVHFTGSKVLRDEVDVLAEPIARPLDLDDDGVVEEPIEQRRGDDRIAEDVAPFGEAFEVRIIAPFS
jgi:hypothetical protein